MNYYILELRVDVDLRFVLIQIANGKYRVTFHAQKRMIERRVTHSDVRRCAKTGSANWEEDKIRIVGKDLDNEELTLICVFTEDIILITVF